MTRIIVVGNGMVGYRFYEKLRKSAAGSAFEVIVYGEEPRPAYDRVHLSDYFRGMTADDLLMAPRSWYAEHDIELHTGELITEIDREGKTVRKIGRASCRERV